MKADAEPLRFLTSRLPTAAYHDRPGIRRRARALCIDPFRTSSGPEGSSDKVPRPSAADPPEPFFRPRSHYFGHGLSGSRPQVASAGLRERRRPGTGRHGPAERARRRACRAGVPLFSGIRGVGKTSVARVFAKALNCENEPPSDPLQRMCTSCAEITGGLQSRRARDRRRHLLQGRAGARAHGKPALRTGARSSYKVVIIDEIHRLSRQAFDALLKIVEEPPDHLVFMFATTEIQAVPATILSRCQSFQLRRVPQAEMVDAPRQHQ